MLIISVKNKALFFLPAALTSVSFGFAQARARVRLNPGVKQPEDCWICAKPTALTKYVTLECAP